VYPSQGQRVPARLAGLAAAGLARHEPQIRALTRLEQPPEDFHRTGSLAVRGVTVHLDLSGAIDLGAERARLTKDLAAARKEVTGASAKLGNADFLARAPEPVVAKMRGRLADAETEIARISAQLDALPAS
jgi:valyl-tRNA synthetase